jgi:hypothetical protein
MRVKWEAHDAHYELDVDYDACSASDTESEMDEWEDDSDDYAEDPDEEWYARKNSYL